MTAKRLLTGEPIPALLTPSELRAALGWSRTTFWRWEKAGKFQDLAIEVVPGVIAYSGAKLLARIEAGQSIGRKYFRGQKRRRTKVRDEEV